MQDLLDTLCSASSQNQKVAALFSLALCPKSQDEARHVMASFPRIRHLLRIHPKATCALMLDLMGSHGATSVELGLDRGDVQVIATNVLRGQTQQDMRLLQLVLQTREADPYHEALMAELAATLPHLEGCSAANIVSRLWLLHTIMQEFPFVDVRVLPHWDVFLDCLSLCYDEAAELLKDLKNVASIEQVTAMFQTALGLARSKPDCVAGLAHLVCAFSSRFAARKTFADLSGVDFLLESVDSLRVAAAAHFPNHRFSISQVEACAAWFATCDESESELGGLVLARALAQKPCSRELLLRCLPRTFARLKRDPRSPGWTILIRLLARDACCAALIVKAGFANLI